MLAITAAIGKGRGRAIRSLRSTPVACRVIPVLAVEALVRPASGTHETHVGCRLLCPSALRRREVRKSAAYDPAMGLFRSAMRLFRSGAGKDREEAAAELPEEQTPGGGRAPGRAPPGGGRAPGRAPRRPSSRTSTQAAAELPDEHPQAAAELPDEHPQAAAELPDEHPQAAAELPDEHPQAAAELPDEQTQAVKAQPEVAPREVKHEARPNPDKPGWGLTIGQEIRKAREDRGSQE